MALRNYELMMVLLPDMDDDAKEEALNRVNRYVDDNGGTIESQEKWGNVRKLAYPINDHTEGSYILTNLKLEPSSVGDLDASLKVSENILRHLIIKVDQFQETVTSGNDSTTEVNAESTVTEKAEASTDDSGPEEIPNEGAGVVVEEEQASAELDEVVSESETDNNLEEVATEGNAEVGTEDKASEQQ